jgi:molybdopterin molybdotransferase
MTRPLADDCFVLDRPRLTHAEAIEILRARLTPIAAVERVPLQAAAGRLLAGPVRADLDVPAHTNAAVDGFAIAHVHYATRADGMFAVAGRAAAGVAGRQSIDPTTAVRIFTGAALPAGFDTCAMQEDCRIEPSSGQVHVPPGLKRGANVRRAGEDVRAGASLFTGGERLRAQDLAALASIGRTQVDVFAPLRVGLLSSGDELVAPGEPLRAGQVYDANKPMLMELVRSSGARVVDFGVVRDQREAVEATVAEASQRCDVLITTGGASRGEEDHLAPAIERLGTRQIWQIAVKPGRPLSFGRIGSTVVLGLPGNPVAVFVCFLLYGWPLLRALGGGGWPEPEAYDLPAAFEFTGRKAGRREYWRGRRLVRDGRPMVEKFARDGSGLITGLREADGLIEIPEATGDIKAGASVRFLPFSQYGLLR